MTAPETAAAPTAEKSSLLEDFVDILFAPSKVFARRGSGGAWGPFFIVAIILIVLTIVNAGAMQGVMDAEFNRAMTQAMEQNPNLTEEQMSGMRGMMEMSMKWGAVVIIPIVLLVLSLFVWVVGKMFGSTLSFGGGVMVASFAYVPRVIDSMLVAIQALFLDTATFASRWQFSLGVGRFMDPNGPQGMLNFLGRIDVFTIWVTVLIVLGLTHAGKVPKEKAIIGGVVIWILGALPFVPALISGK